MEIFTFLYKIKSKKKFIIKSKRKCFILNKKKKENVYLNGGICAIHIIIVSPERIGSIGGRSEFLGAFLGSGGATGFVDPNS